MEQFHWTYEQYMGQPLWFYELLGVKLEAEDIANEYERAEIESKNDGRSS